MAGNFKFLFYFFSHPRFWVWGLWYGATVDVQMCRVRSAVHRVGGDARIVARVGPGHVVHGQYGWVRVERRDGGRTGTAVHRAAVLQPGQVQRQIALVHRARHLYPRALGQLGEIKRSDFWWRWKQKTETTAAGRMGEQTQIRVINNTYKSHTWYYYVL